MPSAMRGSSAPAPSSAPGPSSAPSASPWAWLLCCGMGDTRARGRDEGEAVEFESLLGANIDRDIERFDLGVDDDGEDDLDVGDAPVVAEDDDEFFGPAKGRRRVASSPQTPQQPAAAAPMSTEQLKRITTLVQHQVRLDDADAAQVQQRDRELELAALYRKPSPKKQQPAPPPPTEVDGASPPASPVAGSPPAASSSSLAAIDVGGVPLIPPPPPTHKAFSVTRDFDDFMSKLKAEMEAKGTPLAPPAAADA